MASIFGPAGCGWIGEAGPGPFYGDDPEGAEASGSTTRSPSAMLRLTWNLLHKAPLLKDAGGLPNPEHRA